MAQDTPGREPRIAVIVPHLNQPDHLERSLSALDAQSFDRAEVEVVVVDNGSRALPREVVARHPGVRLIEEPEPGPGPARNAGVAATRAPLLAFVDADCVADPRWLEVIADAFRDPQAEVIGGDVRILMRDPARPGPIEAYEAIFAFRQREYIRKMGFSGTGNLAMRREVFARVGPFAGIGAAEDAEWGRRARARGVVTRYEPRMIVHHPARESLRELQLKWDRHISHQFAEAAAQGRRGLAKWALKTAAMALSPAAEIPRILASDRVPDMRARLLAFGVLTRIRAYRARRMLEALLGGAARGASGRWNRD
ncbi:glycosyltransferase [Oceanicella actignis]|uniref:glycosyltransferase n=1 Tax=Oceanicella actignis TaxID=1189325 RepID=UPI0011E86F7E|nr:glycosyltransferase [Oceanicella actignis]TYO88774.1 glycosyl transferase family 2 [Oceanicella actignis]